MTREIISRKGNDQSQNGIDFLNAVIFVPLKEIIEIADNMQ